MQYSFKRIDELNVHEFYGQMKAQYAALDRLLAGDIPENELISYVRAMLADGRPCRDFPEGLFWGYTEPENMPGDAWIDLFYMPTYLNTAFLIQAYRVLPDPAAVPGLADGLTRALFASSCRGLRGHFYDDDYFAQGLKIFASVHTKNFIRTHPDLVPDSFIVSYFAAANVAESAIANEDDYLTMAAANGHIQHLDDYRAIAALEMDDSSRHTLFVYGTLMRGRVNHAAFMKNALFLGKARLLGYLLYDLGSYPAIKPVDSDAAVLGELYDVSEDDFNNICRLEGNGCLYEYRSVYAYLMFADYLAPIPAETFVYLGRTDRLTPIPVSRQPW